MIRCTIELLPGGNESRARTIGVVEIANIGGTQDVGEYAVILKKTPPFSGALRAAWRRGRLKHDAMADIVSDIETGEDDEIIAAKVAGHHRTRRGSYDLLYRALKACGLETRVPREERS
jgi:hypothetical protein